MLVINAMVGRSGKVCDHEFGPLTILLPILIVMEGLGGEATCVGAVAIALSVRFARRGLSGGGGVVDVGCSFVGDGLFSADKAASSCASESKRVAELELDTQMGIEEGCLGADELGAVDSSTSSACGSGAASSFAVSLASDAATVVGVLPPFLCQSANGPRCSIHDDSVAQPLQPLSRLREALSVRDGSVSPFMSDSSISVASTCASSFASLPTSL